MVRPAPTAPSPKPAQSYKATTGEWLPFLSHVMTCFHAVHDVSARSFFGCGWMLQKRARTITHFVNRDALRMISKNARPFTGLGPLDCHHSYRTKLSMSDSSSCQVPKLHHVVIVSPLLADDLKKVGRQRVPTPFLRRRVSIMPWRRGLFPSPGFRLQAGEVNTLGSPLILTCK